MNLREEKRKKLENYFKVSLLLEENKCVEELIQEKSNFQMCSASESLHRNESLVSSYVMEQTMLCVQVNDGRQKLGVSSPAE